MNLRSLGLRLAAAPPRTRALLVAGAGAAALLLAASGDPLFSVAGRGAAATLALAGIAWWARGRSPLPPAAARIRVVETRSLARDAAVALLHVEGRSLLVGWGAEGVRLLADLGGGGPGAEP